MRHAWIAGAAFAAAIACVDTSELAGGPDGCAIGQQRLDGRCVDAPAPQPVNPDGTCAAGLQDNDKDGTCEASCTSAKLDCGAHAKCDDGKGKVTCVCATGYERAGDTCNWLGGARDPGFANKPTKAWETLGAVAIDPTATAPVDPGVARFDTPASCDGKALVRQTFPMPAFADSEPFAVEIDATNGGAGQGAGFDVIVGGGWLGELRPFQTPRLHQCAGERAYGRDVLLSIRRLFDDSCGPGSKLEIDRAALVPDAKCPPLGRVLNEDFEANGGWTSSGTGAEVATAVGTAGGRGGRLFTDKRCQEPKLVGTISAPFTSIARPALGFSFKGTTDQKMQVALGGFGLGEVTGTATFEGATLCIPEFAKGMVHALELRLDDPGGLCAVPNVRDFVFDDMKLVSSASCPESAFVANGGFEDPVLPSSVWRFSKTTDFTTSFQIAKGGSHGGASHLALSVGQVCASAAATQTITVPPSDAGGGPAVKLFYRAPGLANASFRVELGDQTVALGKAPEWTSKVVCLPPVGTGTPRQLELTAYGGSGTCANTYTSETLEVDDVVVGTDPSCPK